MKKKSMKKKLISLGTKEMTKIRGGKNLTDECNNYTLDGGELETVVVVGNKPSK